ncbi:MAG: DUF1684 domain-containing protein [Candidatus Solibacter usitatus]|nr:DUF1684 domain-containing protein [Candidatus Solibacter usitatus]
MLYRSSFILFAAVLLADPGYQSQMVNWRRNYETGLKKENGWLAVTGLFWLKDGQNRFGSAAANEIRLPSGAPAQAGSFELHEGKVWLNIERDVDLQLNDKPATARYLAPDSAEAPDLITLGDLAMQVLVRGQRFAIRLWDNNSRARQNFPGLGWFPAAEEYRITAAFTAYAEPKMIPIADVLGETTPTASPGFVTFTIRGKEYRLEPVTEDNQLFFMFKDLTSGKQTYPAGRFLYAEMPRNGKVVLDFNRAHNPPCAYTAYATCPLPPPQNALAVRIEAGELNFKPDKRSK